ncbi:hypothetical protein QVD99_002759 [Batrachochytrium dendrobatidis]|nr:hypothetical protein QVD99_002759 [Batrachochytrium dendrobatidis]
MKPFDPIRAFLDFPEDDDMSTESNCLPQKDIGSLLHCYHTPALANKLQPAEVAAIPDMSYLFNITDTTPDPIFHFQLSPSLALNELGTENDTANPLVVAQHSAAHVACGPVTPPASDIGCKSPHEPNSLTHSYQQLSDRLNNTTGTFDEFSLNQHKSFGANIPSKPDISNIAQNCTHPLASATNKNTDLSSPALPLQILSSLIWSAAENNSAKLVSTELFQNDQASQKKPTSCNTNISSATGFGVSRLLPPQFPTTSVTPPIMDKRQERLMKNRHAADLSRKRKRQQAHKMESSLEELQTQNLHLTTRVSQLEQLNKALTEDNLRLSRQLQMYGTSSFSSSHARIRTHSEDSSASNINLNKNSFDHQSPHSSIRLSPFPLSLTSDSYEDLWFNQDLDHTHSPSMPYSDPIMGANTSIITGKSLGAVFMVVMFSFASVFMPGSLISNTRIHARPQYSTAPQNFITYVPSIHNDAHTYRSQSFLTLSPAYRPLIDPYSFQSNPSTMSNEPISDYTPSTYLSNYYLDLNSDSVKSAVSHLADVQLPKSKTKTHFPKNDALNTIALSLARPEFIASLSSMATMNPPNAAGVFQRLFLENPFCKDSTNVGNASLMLTDEQEQSNQMDQKRLNQHDPTLSTPVDPYPTFSSTANMTLAWSALFESEQYRTILQHMAGSSLQHSRNSSDTFAYDSIKLVPYQSSFPMCSNLNGGICRVTDELRFTILADVSTTQHVKGNKKEHDLGGLLQLDVEVVSAKWVGTSLY